MNQKRHPLLKRLLAGLAGLAFVLAIICGFYEAAQSPEPSGPDSGLLAPPDPLSAELRRCSALPQTEAMDDKLCRRAWILNRQRFFGQSGDLLSEPSDKDKE